MNEPDYEMDKFVHESLVKEVGILRERNRDMMEQITVFLNSDRITPDQMRDIRRTKSEHTTLNDAQNTITTFMRDNIPGFANGRYVGMSFPDTVIYFLKIAIRVKRFLPWL